MILELALAFMLIQGKPQAAPPASPPAQECLTYEAARQRIPREFQQIQELTEPRDVESFVQATMRVLGAPRIDVDRVVFFALEDSVLIGGFRGGCLVASGMVPREVFTRLVPSV